MFGIIPWQVVDPMVPGTFIAPDFFPKALAGFLIFLSILLIYNGHTTAAESDRAEEKRITTATLLCIALILIAIWAIRWVGMMPAVCVAMILLMRMFGYQDLKKSILISVGFVIVMFLFFEKIASISIPRGALFNGLF
ncbi:MAG: tripartite tricarboxylate transporter TctB family protein, partial [Rhodospirillaceae bacterium]|nr:tripartite tricarboxylate transporter TctB family protein [Rhodospirillaceae bacterium]